MRSLFNKIMCVLIITCTSMLTYSSVRILLTGPQAEGVTPKRMHPPEHFKAFQRIAKNYSISRRGRTIDDILGMTPPRYLKDYKNPCWYKKSENSKLVLQCLPYFRLIGVDKCGTTDLWYRMAQHPHIVRLNGVMGFDIWVKNKPALDFDWYLSHFIQPAKKIERNVTLRNGMPFHSMITAGKDKHHDHGMKQGGIFLSDITFIDDIAVIVDQHPAKWEGSPTEFWDFTGWDLIPQNQEKTADQAFLTPHCLKHMTPDVKLIVIFRNPTERLYSDYLFLDRFRAVHNVSVEGFHHDVLRSIEMLQDCMRVHTHRHCFYNKELHMKIPVRLIVGLYDIFLAEWLKVFPSQQLLILRNEDYAKNIKLTLATIFSFLDLPALSDKQLEKICALPRVFEKTAVSKKLGSMYDKTKILLDDFYRPFNEMLAHRLNDANYLWN